MSFLVCEKCNQYYELQPGELPTDFNDNCECGGNLKFKSSLNEVEEKQFLEESVAGRKMKVKPSGKLLSVSLILIGKILLVIFLLIIAVAGFPFGTLGAIFIFWVVFFKKGNFKNK